VIANGRAQSQPRGLMGGRSRTSRCRNEPERAERPKADRGIIGHKSMSTPKTTTGSTTKFPISAADTEAGILKASRKLIEAYCVNVTYRDIARSAAKAGSSRRRKKWGLRYANIRK